MNTNSNYTKFAGNPFTSLVTIFVLLLLLISIIRMMLGISDFADKSYPTSAGRNLLIGIGILVTLYAILVLNSFYFLVSDRELIVTNHFFPLINKRYDLSEIKWFCIANVVKGSKSLRISTGRFRQRTYLAGSLSNHQWEMLREKLESLNIPYYK